MKELIICLIVLPVFLVLVIFSRAVSVKLVTGKWPHEDERSRRLFQRMP